MKKTKNGIILQQKKSRYFYCLNCLHSFRTESKLMSHEKVYKNKDFCGIVMPSKKKSDKTRYIFYADIESLIRK